MAIAATDPGAQGLHADPAEHGRDALSDDALSAWGALRGAVYERVRLLSLEARLAGLTFVQLVMYAIVAAVLVVTAWIGLMGGIVVALVSAGLHWAIGLAVGIALNLGAAFWLVRAMLALLERLDMQATLRRLQGRMASRAE